jgi:hypothetical protein
VILGTFGSFLQLASAPCSIHSIGQTIDPSRVRVAMASSRGKRVISSIGGAFCMLLLVGGVAPGAAYASCSHDVSSRASRSIQDSLADLELFRYTAALSDRLPVSPPESPCNGPSCSGRQGFPQAPAQSLSPRSDPWCSMSIAAYRINSNSTHQFDTSPRPHPRHETVPPERPPRPARDLPLA